MKLEDQLCSLELAKQLKEAGVKQDSVWSWYYNMTGHEWRENEVWWRLQLTKKELIGNCYMIAAFTVAELGEMLPSIFDNYDLTIIKQVSDEWRISYYYNTITFEDKWMLSNQWIEAKTEADARAKMLIYLIDQGIINQEDI